MTNADLERIFDQWLDDAFGVLLDEVLAETMYMGVRVWREQSWFCHQCLLFRDIELVLDTFGNLDAPV